eukprot:CAMPEP_0113493666 /NCGR_PEP_ID=MMETSP0014_2-20120614/28709_1 /TAXON_ID=2857 /ORGANISM="Nitzschia sp." /LENGTH=491 /DNA_ID=CAMNT_0000387535 /DNA_START=1 /DNA_END=1476 /DNA_ORIENTATION=+ /assembly_acc=CAM_ASM_000159
MMKQDLLKISRSGERRTNQLMFLVALVTVVTVSVDAVPPVIRPEASASATTAAAMGMVTSHDNDKPTPAAAFIVKSSVNNFNKIRGGNLDDLDIDGGGNTPPVYDDEDDEEQYDLEDEDLEEEDEMMEDAEHILEDSDTEEEEEEDEDVDDWEDLEELEEDIIAVEVSALQEEDDLEEQEDAEEDLKDIMDDVLEDLEEENLEDDSPVMVGATTTDGELADDEETDSSGVASAEELVAVTAGGASAVVDDDDDDGTEEEVTTSPTSSTSVVTSVDIEEVSGISDEMKLILRNELSYTRREVKLMRPEIAAMVVYNRLSRPGEGMPPNFYVEGYGPPGPLREHGSKIVVTAIAVGTVALTATTLKDGDFDLDDIVDALTSIPKALLAAGAAVSGKVGASLPSKKSEAVAEPADKVGMVGLPGEMIEAEVVEETTRGSPEEDNTDETAIEDDSVHSIKPGTKTGPKVNEDETAFDKFLTKVENLIKGFFRIKI